MDSKNFAENALRTEAPIEKLNVNLSGLAALLKLAVQNAHLLDLCKKTIAYGKDLDQLKLVEACEDCADAFADFADELPTLNNPNGPSAGLHQPNLRLLHAAIGMAGEAGELLAAVLQQIQTGELDMVNVSEELADSDWYKAIAHDEIGIPEEVSRERVINKLKIRYPGKFSLASAENRDLAAERKALEGTSNAKAA
jgi:hypothetical protein